MRSIVLFSIFLLVASCVSMSKEECQSMNWKAKGHEDAYAGKTINDLGSYQKQCSKHDVDVNKEEYTAGFNKGLHKFCSVERARSFALSGGIYKGQCPEELEKDFSREYNLSLREYKLKQREEEIQEQQDYIADRERDGDFTLRHMIAVNSGRKCSFDSDCTIEDECSRSRCEKSGKKCTTDSDCDYEGDCDFSRCAYN